MEYESDQLVWDAVVVESHEDIVSEDERLDEHVLADALVPE